MNSHMHRLPVFLRSVLLPLSVSTLLIVAAACAPEESNVQEDVEVGETAPMESTEQQPLMEVAAGAEGLSTFTDLANRVGLESELAQGPYTVFAPSDEAFENIQEATLGSLTEEDNDPLLRSILRNHIVEDEVLSADATGSTSVTTLEGETLLIERTGNTIQVNGVEVLQSDVQADNGVIHIINGVLLPSDRSLNTEGQ